MIVYNPYLDYPNKIRRFLDGKISHMNDEYTDHHKENTWVEHLFDFRTSSYYPIMQTNVILNKSAANITHDNIARYRFKKLSHDNNMTTQQLINFCNRLDNVPFDLNAQILYSFQQLLGLIILFGCSKEYLYGISWNEDLKPQRDLGQYSAEDLVEIVREENFRS